MSARRWPFMAQPAAPVEAGALSDDGGKYWLVIDGEGRFLRCFFAGEPDWCYLRANARRHDAAGADSVLRKLAGQGVACALKVAA